MQTLPFTHLHVHSEYSLLDGSAKVTELISRAKEMGMDSIAITDHGVMYGAIDFYKKAIDAGIKPIIGCEVYVATGSRFEKERRDDGNYHHLVLLAENDIGYHNLMKLVSIGFTEGFYYRPRVDIECIRQYSGGLIALSGCLAGVVPRMMEVSYAAGKERALLFNEIFGQGNFYLEIQDHGLEDQKLVNTRLIRMSEETGIPLVATNDIHYIEASDERAHEVLLCIQTAKTILDEGRMRYGSDQFYLKTSQEMYDLFPDNIDALANTQKIADRCNIKIEFNNYKLPKFPLPEGYTTQQYLRELCEKGLQNRYGEDAPQYQSRLDYELGVIENMGFPDYFLVVADFIKYAHDNGIIVGPGRGSGAGSIVAYALRITDIDPIPFDLLFERFLNPERISMPDFDIDFCYERRQEVIDYVINKYGADNTAQIITFGKLKAKAVTRDVGRALAIPYGDVDRIAKMIPNDLGMTLEKALAMNPELKDAYDNEPQTREVIDMGMRLEGLPRHAGTHAAGVVLADRPVYEYIPLNTNDGLVTTQYPMGTVEELGLLKMDFLGLRTLTVIRFAVEEIRRRHGVEIDLYKWDYNDPKVFEMISAGRTSGVFQVESSGMTSFMRELQPESVEDLTAGISLYRPGPMDFIPQYIKGKRDPSRISYMHKSLEPILKATYGCIVYQEQVMQIVRDLAGYSLGRSDLIRRAMSKKQADVMAHERQNFIYGIPSQNVPGCVKNGIPESAANKIFDAMVAFAAYAFNKSHGAAYSYITYQTAWLRLYYPVEFMAALMTSVIDNASKVAAYIHECKKMGITMLPPDINEGFAVFSVSGEREIRFGLSSIKNVGRGVVNYLVNEREKGGKFTSLTNFIRRMAGADINKRCMESLIRAGAMDSLGGRRSQYITAFEGIMDGQAHTKKSTLSGQLSLFDFDDTPPEDIDTDNLADINEFPKRLLLFDEKELIGMYLSGHPLAEYVGWLAGYSQLTSLDFAGGTEDTDETAESSPDTPTKFKDRDVVVYGGMITAKSVKYTKADNKPFCFLTVEDIYGPVEVIVFSKMYEKFGGRLQNDQVIVVQGRVSFREDEATKITAQDILFYDDMAYETSSLAVPRLAEAEVSRDHEPKQTFWIKIPAGCNIQLKSITDILTTHYGTTRVMIYNEAQGKKIQARPEYWVTPSELLERDLEALLGGGCVKVTG